MSERIFVGVPVLNRLDLLARCLDHIDVPADVLIVNNNSIDETFRSELRDLAGRRGLEVHDQERNRGVAASWNYILAAGIGWGREIVFIGSNDTFLHPGALAAMLERIRGSREDELIWHLHAWNFFAMHTEAVSRVGWFDENFYPAYREDQDYQYRCDVLAGVRRVAPNLGAEHFESQTIRSDPEYHRLAVEIHLGLNTQYYERKWGGPPGAERFTSPFGHADRDWRWWPDPGETIWKRDWDSDRRRRLRQSRRSVAGGAS
jgi:GT2 family glycosyltransferase